MSGNRILILSLSVVLRMQDQISYSFRMMSDVLMKICMNKRTQKNVMAPLSASRICHELRVTEKINVYAI